MVLDEELECCEFGGVGCVEESASLGLPCMVLLHEDGCHVTENLDNVGFGQIALTHQIDQILLIQFRSDHVVQVIQFLILPQECGRESDLDCALDHAEHIAELLRR